MPKCCVKNCKNHSYKNSLKTLKFYQFPKENELKNQWIVACGYNPADFKVKDARVCSIHFNSADLKEKSLQQILLKYSPLKSRGIKKDAVPHLNLFWKNTSVESNVGNSVQYTNECSEKSSLEKISTCSSACQESFTGTSAPPNNSCQDATDNPMSFNYSLDNPPETSNVQMSECQDNFQVSAASAPKNESCQIEGEDCISFNLPTENPSVHTSSSEKLTSTLSDHSCQEKNNVPFSLLDEPNDKSAPSSSESSKNTRKSELNNSHNLDIKNLQHQLSVLREKYKKSQSEIVYWQKKCKKKTQENKVIKQKIEEEYHKLLSDVFTPGQVKKLFNPKKRVRWSTEDISAAISLKCVSAKAYRYLRNNVKLPLPAVSTLKKWISNFHCDPGILTEVLKIMKIKAETFSIRDKITVLSFDEMGLSRLVSIDRKREQKVGPHKHVQVLTARGLFQTWKQPIFYDFDTPMTSEILLNIIKRLYECGFIVVATVCDLGPNNKSLFHDLDCELTDPEKCFFAHPCDENLLVHTFLDTPHLLKLIRNHFLDQGFNIDGEFVNKTVVEELLSINSCEINIAHKISQAHLDVKGSERQNVKMAAKLLSNTIGKALLYCGMKGWLTNPSVETAGKLFCLINDWFDIFNSKLKFEPNKPAAYGLNLKKQDSVLHDMDDFITDLRVGDHKGLIEFQKGILRNNRSLPSLFQYLKVKYSRDFKVQYILTRRVNQDVLENLFSFFRAMGGPNDHPTALDCKHRIRNYIIGKHSTDLFSLGTNTVPEDGDEKLIHLNEIITGAFFNNVYEEENEEEAEEQEDQEEEDDDVNEPAQKKSKITEVEELEVLVS